MARISLRTYHREVEVLVESGRIDEAIAHCRYILRFYPKCLETYRLLGKSFLESQRYGDAADIFQRVLSSAPEDFIAHAGMSIIRQDEGHLDEALWHMERAFEMQPANSAIQEELRYLYGKRDGFEPPKVRLTRGALARMYAKGDLYPQAIGELRSALADDPQRLDLQVLLANVYLSSGQLAEAADSAANVLRKLPNCLEANRVMAEALTRSGHVDEATVHLQRIQALDPYSAHLSPTTPSSAKVPDMAVALEKLDWTPGTARGEPTQPEWAASLGVQIKGMAPDQEILPNWLSSVEGTGLPATTSAAALGAAAFATAASQPQAPPKTGELPAIEPTPEETLPDWMRSAGWVAADEAATRGEAGQAATASTAEETPVTGAVMDEIPEWLQSMAPAGATETTGAQAKPDEFSWLGGGTPAAPASEVDAGIPAWLGAGATAAVAAGIATQREPAQPEPPVVEPAAETLAMPEWLQGQAAQIQADELADSTAASELPEWLRDAEQEVSPSPASLALGDETEQVVDVPDWLKDLQPEGTEAPQPEIPSGILATAAIASAVEVPDWLKELEPEATQPVTSENLTEASATKAAVAESEVSDWYPDLQPESPLTPPVEISEPAMAEAAIASEDEIPEWLKELEPPEVSDVPTTGIPLAAAAELAVSTAPEVQPQEQPKPLEAGALAAGESGPGLAAAGAVAIGAAALSAFAHKENEPEPVKAEIVEPTKPTFEQPVAEVTAGQGEPDTTPPTEIDLTDSDAAFAWLEALAVKQGAEEALLLKPEERLETPPDWVQEAQAAEGAAVEESPLLPSAAAVTLPAWLLENAPTPPPVEEAPLAEPAGAPIEELSTLPAWLAESAAGPTSEVPTPLEPTEPSGLPAWFLENPIDEALPAPATEEAAIPAIEPVALPDWLQEISPAGTPIIEEPEILAAEPGALPDWLVEAAPEKLTTFDTALEAPALEETFTRPVEGSAQEAQAPSGAKLAAAALAGAGAAALVSSRETQEAPLLEEDTKPVRVSKPASSIAEPEPPAQAVATPQEPSGAESLAAIAAAGLISEAAIEKSSFVEGSPQETITPTVSAEEETEAAFAWLESLAAKQGAEEALLLKPEERLETPPAWVQEAILADELNLAPAAEAAIKPTEEAAIPAEVTEALPDWLLEHEPEQPSGLSEAGAISIAAGVIPGWLKEMETPGEPVEAAPTEAAPAETVSADAPPELPSWLKEIETEPASSQPAELETWTPPPLEAIPSPAPLDLNVASLAEMERLPGVGFILAQAIVEHREQNGAFKSVDDLSQVSGLSPSTFTDIRDHFVVAAPIAVTTAPPPQGVEPPASGVALPSGVNLPAIDQARETLIQGDIQRAVDQYSALIHSRQSLPDVIRDLTEATYRYPVEAPIWQTLGDAYMRSDQLQEALDAYTKAEELLR